MSLDLFNHFIVTRFNLKVSTWANDKNGQEVNDEKWLKERYELFEKYCFPSIKLQTEQNFKWLVYFDIDTPNSYKEKNNQLASIFSNFTPMYAKSHDDFVNTLSDRINLNITDYKPYLITTRLDNDDALHKDAVKMIQHYFEASDETIVDLCNGLCFQNDKQVKLSKKEMKYGPFISLISKYNLNVRNLTIYDKAHRKWDTFPNYIGISDGYFWMQIIHDRNMLNDLSNNLTFDKSLLQGFDFLSPIRFSVKYYLFIIFKHLKTKFS